MLWSVRWDGEVLWSVRWMRMPICRDMMGECGCGCYGRRLCEDGVHEDVNMDIMCCCSCMWCLS